MLLVSYWDWGFEEGWVEACLWEVVLAYLDCLAYLLDHRAYHLVEDLHDVLDDQGVGHPS